MHSELPEERLIGAITVRDTFDASFEMIKELENLTTDGNYQVSLCAIEMTLAREVFRPTGEEIIQYAKRLHELCLNSRGERDEDIVCEVRETLDRLPDDSVKAELIQELAQYNLL